MQSTRTAISLSAIFREYGVRISQTFHNHIAISTSQRQNINCERDGKIYEHTPTDKQVTGPCQNRKTNGDRH